MGVEGLVQHSPLQQRVAAVAEGAPTLPVCAGVGARSAGVDHCFPRVDYLQDRGGYEDMKPIWDAFNEHIVEAGSWHGITVAPAHQLN